MTKILVTGGSGALGREIVKCLANTGYSVRIMSRNPERHAEQTTTAIEWVQGNLASDQGLAESVADVDVLVHAATDPLHSRQIDVNGTRLLLAKARETGVVSHVVYISIVGIDRIEYGYYTSKLAIDAYLAQAARLIPSRHPTLAPRQSSLRLSSWLQYLLLFRSAKRHYHLERMGAKKYVKR